METETTTGTAKLNESLAKAQAEMAVAEMTGHNPHFNSKFSTLADLVAAARPSLSKYGLSVTQSSDLIDGRYWILTTLRHTSGEFIGSRLQLIVGKQDMQALGSALSYGQRYEYRGITGVVSKEDDDDGTAAVGSMQGEKSAHAQMPTTSQPKLVPSDPGDVICEFGRDKGKLIKQIPLKDLVSSVSYWERRAVNDKKPLSGKLLIYVNAAKAVLLQAQRGAHTAAQSGQIPESFEDIPF